MRSRLSVECLSRPRARDLVLMGHSQGTGMLTAMMAQDVDPVPEVRAKLISALLIGGSVAIPNGAAVGGTHKNLELDVLIETVRLQAAAALK